jgi:cytochrome c oxidase subunit 4
MAAQHHSSADQGNRKRHHEGPRNHFLSFALSIILTILAFAAVMANLGRTFTIMFIVLLALIQVIFQLAFWMHMKDKGHFYATVGIVTGAFVALTAVAATVYWIWW